MKVPGSKWPHARGARSVQSKDITMKHLLVDLYEIWLNGSRSVQNDPVAGGFGFKIKQTSRSSSPKLLRCLKFHV